jgi:hypothetical protein
MYDAMTDPYVLGPLAACRKKYFRGRRVRVFFQEMMLSGPDVVVAAAIGQVYLFQRVLQ